MRAVQIDPNPSPTSSLRRKHVAAAQNRLAHAVAALSGPTPTGCACPKAPVGWRRPTSKLPALCWGLEEVAKCVDTYRLAVPPSQASAP
jgi:hypothetical protein